MSTTRRRAAVAAGTAVAAALAALGTTAALADGDEGRRTGSIAERLTGYEEVPAVSTTGTGSFRAQVDRDAQEITYTLSYADLQGSVQQAHIHFGQRSVNGGVSAFLCSNVGGPAGTQPCPTPSGTVTGTITPANVIGPAGQGIAAGEFDELVAAIRAGVAYANVHSTTWPGGEIRAQLDRGRHHHH